MVSPCWRGVELGEKVLLLLVASELLVDVDSEVLLDVEVV